MTAIQRSNMLPFRPSEGSVRQLDTRLATRISAQADRRLRLTALVHGMRLGHLLDQILSQHLPTADQLTAQISAEGKETTTDER